MDDKKQGNWRGVSAARLHWAIIDACKHYGLDIIYPKDPSDISVGQLLHELRRDQAPGSGWETWTMDEKGVDVDG